MSLLTKRSALEIVATTRRMAIVAVVALVVAACSGSTEPAAVLDPVPAIESDDSGPVVVEPPPTVTSVPERTLADDGAASINEFAAGEEAVDLLGNLLAVHAMRQAPDSAAPASIIDVSLCAAGEFFEAEASGSFEFQVASDSDAPLASSLAPSPVIPFATPAFMLPDAGGCVRGWVPAAVDAAPAGTTATARYIISTLTDVGLERHVYQWSVPVQGQAAAHDGDLRVGQRATFAVDPLQGTSVQFNGWTELIGEPARPERRVVALDVEVCLGSRTWPELGIGVDGWNLPSTETAEQFAREPDGELVGTCFRDWLQFSIPVGAVPTSFYAGGLRDLEAGFVQWTLDGAAVQPPE